MVLLESLNIPLGTEAADFALPATDGQTYSLDSFADRKILVIVFMCNHCPYVQAVWQRLNDLKEKYADKAVQFVGINPNFHPDYPEETMEKMREYYAQYKMNFPYLLDETQEVAKAYKAQCTPDIYVFDENRELKYHGRIDDNWQSPGEVEGKELDKALADLVEGRTVSDEQKPSMGCSIKWRD